MLTSTATVSPGLAWGVLTISRPFSTTGFSGTAAVMATSMTFEETTAPVLNSYPALFRSSKRQNARLRIVAATGHVAHFPKVLCANNAAQIKKQAVVLQVRFRCDILRAAVQSVQGGILAQIQRGQLVSVTL